MISYEVRWHKRMETIVVPELCFDLYGNKIPNVYIYNGLSITFNLRQMLNWAFENNSDWLIEIHCQKGEYVAEKAQKALDKLRAKKEEAEQYNSPNGWGTYDDCLFFVNELKIEAKRYSDLICDIKR